VPQGVSAELYLSGAGITRGYLGRAAMTAERFVPNPFGGNGERLYRTGDLIRQREEGELEYMGRIDHQVKIRGFRIELGEIEARLLAHAAVREAVVVASEVSGSQQLVAYLVPSDPAIIDASAEQQAALQQSLGNWLGATLPDYMVPSHRLWLAQLPLTPNGKIDRKRLPALDSAPRSCMSNRRMPLSRRWCRSGKRYWALSRSAPTTVSLPWAATRSSRFRWSVAPVSKGWS
jgi:acyl-coenzyme A synthetase/AMP-(fatty) acid ligase